MMVIIYNIYVPLNNVQYKHIDRNNCFLKLNALPKPHFQF